MRNPKIPSTVMEEPSSCWLSQIEEEHGINYLRLHTILEDVLLKSEHKGIKWISMTFHLLQKGLAWYKYCVYQ